MRKSVRSERDLKETHLVDLGNVLESLDLHLSHDFVQVEQLARVERVERLKSARTISHLSRSGQQPQAG